MRPSEKIDFSYKLDFDDSYGNKSTYQRGMSSSSNLVDSKLIDQESEKNIFLNNLNRSGNTMHKRNISQSTKNISLDKKSNSRSHNKNPSISNIKTNTNIRSSDDFDRTSNIKIEEYSNQEENKQDDVNVLDQMVKYRDKLKIIKRMELI